MPYFDEKTEIASFFGKNLSLCDLNTYMLFAGWEVRIVKNCDRGFENAARGRRPRAAFSTEVTVFHYTDRPKPVNNLFIFFLSLKQLCLLTGKKLTQALL